MFKAFYERQQIAVAFHAKLEEIGFPNEFVDYIRI